MNRWKIHLERNPKFAVWVARIDHTSRCAYNRAAARISSAAIRRFVTGGNC